MLQHKQSNCQIAEEQERRGTDGNPASVSDCPRDLDTDNYLMRDRDEHGSPSSHILIDRVPQSRTTAVQKFPHTKSHSKNQSNQKYAKHQEKSRNCTQHDLVSAYEEQRNAARDSVEKLCADLVESSRIPYLEEIEVARCDSQCSEDLSMKSEVVKEFKRAVEMLQTGAAPAMRRGNLPKECILRLKEWFYEHYDHPYPTDSEKLELSRKTLIDVNQISHWFINYRKRVWKPSLPPGHPAIKGGVKKKSRR